MSQQTNLNVSPYFDDFNTTSDYHRILFKPGVPVQARELTSLQSILQNQIEKFGQHFFKEGAKVIPGNTGYNQLYYCVQLNNTYQGVPVSAYASQLIGTKITGQSSGVTAYVDNILLPQDSERGNLTFYINYLNSSTANNSTQTFSDGESLTCDTVITSGLLGNTTIIPGSPFAITLASDSAAIGSSFQIQDGVYFIRGNFVNVKKETLILDQYSNSSNYRVGLFIREEIINSDIDESLNDNSQGFNNYSAPGADRLKISVNLFKKPLTNFIDDSFIELSTITNGVIRSQVNRGDLVGGQFYKTLTDSLAKRTYSEAGDYFVIPFDVSILESLNNNIGNRGLFQVGQFTYGGSVPSDNLALYKISPGRAFVRGYDIETLNSTFIDVEKPRTTKIIEDQSIIYNTGPTLKLNRVDGSPVLGIGNTYVLSLRDSRSGSDPKILVGKEIGVARVYDFRLESGSYSANNANTNEWNISLFDVQTVTDITLNQSITLSPPVFVKGANSGASAFLKDSISAGVALTVYETSGKFLVNEALAFNGISDGRIAIAVTEYSISDVKSVFGTDNGVVGLGSTFSANTIQSTKFNVGIVTISALQYNSNVNILGTNITSTVGVGSTQIFVNSTSGVSVGSSISVGAAITNAFVTGVGNTFVTIGTGSTAGVTTAVTTLSANVGIGSTVIYLQSVSSALTLQARISVGSTGEITNAPITGIGNTFITIGTGSTTGSLLRLLINSPVGIGSTQLFVASTAGISIGNTFNLITGTGTSFGLSVVSLAATSIFIGTGDTQSSVIGIGSTVAFTQISSLVVGSAVTFTNVSTVVVGNAVTFSNLLFTSNVISSNKLFPGNIVKKDNLVQFSNSDNVDINFAKVVSVGSSQITIEAVTSVAGIASGNLPTSSLNVTDFKILTTNLQSSSDNTLYTKLSKSNVATVDLSEANLTIRKIFKVNITSNQLSTPILAGSNETFLPFDEERYSLIRSDGSTEVLTSDKVFLLVGSSQLQIYNLGSNDTGATLVATLRKIKPKAKQKIKNRVNSITIAKSKYSGSGIGATTLDDGLSYGNYPFGTRVQDEILSLNTPDIIEIHGIFESSNTSDASAPKVILSSIISPSTTTTEIVIGEIFIGQTSGAVAICAEKLTNSQISFIYKNDSRFKEGETIVFQESKVKSIIATLDSGSFEISSNYIFTNGQEATFYDYGTIKRKLDSEEPAKRIRIYFSNGYFDSTDDGDITTVESYRQFNYSRDLQSVNGNAVSDIIDIRPRVSSYTVSEGLRSPLEFYGRTFNSSGNSALNILASDESILTTFSYYLGRIDRLFLTKEGVFQVKYGQPSEKPEKPIAIDEALEIATITLPPYLYNIEQASIQFLEYKRYRMVDIKQLENRIRNLEYYTALSLLETNTANFFVPDSDGLNRFKSGFFVDNFGSFKPQEEKIQIKNSVDIKNKELRPRHYTNSVNLIFGPVVNVDPTEDFAFSAIEGDNIRKLNDVVTLDYAETVWLKQVFATRSESVTPFLISFWQGTLELTPSSDTWVDTTRLVAKIINTEGNYAETLNNLARTQNVDPQTGFGPILWNSWQTNWTGRDVINTNRETTDNSTGGRFGVGGWINGGTGGPAALMETETTTVIREDLRETIETGVQTRNGNRTIVSEQFDQTSVGDRVVSRDLIPFMRSRNVEFISKRVKPLTQLYTFFDGENVTKYCIPKLLEISMISGTFQVGENIIGRTINTGLNPDLTDNSARITFRASQLNHKEGSYNIPTSTFVNNPYTNQPLSAAYSSTSTILNVDTFSLSSQAQGQYSGYVESGMTLIGQTSGARANITNVRLISDLSATLIGSFFIPNPNGVNHPRFETGIKTFTIVNDQNNNQNLATTVAEESFTSSGTLETVQDNIISVRNARIENKQEFESRNVNRSLGTQVVGSTVVSQTQRQVVVGWYDPLAQSFLVEDETGVFLTRCEVFFRSKDDMDIPVVFQLRTMENGFPTQKILPFSEIVLNPEDVNISGDGSVATTFEFRSPVYLEGSKEYAICLASNSTKYSVYICRIGENDILTQTFISNQPYLGSLFKSQNASTWEASQWEDLKFTLYRADFVDSGSVEFYSPELTEGNGQVATLLPDSLILSSRKVRVGLGTTLSDSGYVLGNTFSQLGTNATGNLVGVAGSATGTLSISNAGIGYTPTSGSLTFAGVNLVTITGNGRGAVAQVNINNGVAIAATITTSGGSGYQIGDVLGIGSIGAVSVGRNARFSIAGIGQTSEIILDNVQGNFITGSGSTMMYTNSVGVTTTLNASVGGNVTPTAIIVDTDGLHIKINHQNHGMYFSDNLVKISGILPDIKPTKLTAQYDASSTSPITVDSASSFSTFENVGVGTTNIGYAIIGNEIIEYTSVSGNVIGGNIVRGSNSLTYQIGTPVYKYELGGVNLLRINKTHDMNNVTLENPISFDTYHIKLNMNSLDIDNDDRSDDIGYPALYINQTKSAGGYNIKASQNMPFEIITPIVHNVTVRGTNISGEIRTTTGKSISGTEIPYVNNGFETIAINETNYLGTPRLVASKVNENNKLTNVPGAKSLNMRLLLNTVDTRVSPVIDAQRVSVILTSNRVNSIITNYSTDSRVNSIDADPTACQYISKEIVLENSASSIKILVSAHINAKSDIRALYSISENQGFSPIFVPFPGYSNLDIRGQIISEQNNNGESDVFIPKTNTYGYSSDVLEYKEHVFTADQLPLFRAYRIKLLLTSTSQVYVPRIRDLRVIVLA